MMTRRLMLTIFILLIAACDGKEDNTEGQAVNDSKPFVTNTPPPTHTPAPVATLATGEVALTNNFSRVDNAISIKYPDGWLLDTSGNEVQGELTLGSSRAAQRGNLTQSGDLSMHLMWSPDVELVSAPLLTDSDMETVLKAIISEYEGDTTFDEPYTLVIGQRRAARADSLGDEEVKTVLYAVDFGIGVVGYFTFKMVGDIQDRTMEALIAATEYGGPAAIQEDESVRLLPLVTLRHDQNQPVRGALWSADNIRLLSWSDDQTVRVWNVADGTLLLSLQHEARVIQAEWSDDGSKIMTLAEGQPLRLWDASTGNMIYEFTTRATITRFVWSPDETKVAAASVNNSTGTSTAPVWNIETGELLVTVRPSIGSSVEGVVWDHASRWIAVYGSGAEVRVVDVAANQEIMTAMHVISIYGAAFREDGRYLMTWSQDGQVSVWDIETGELVMGFAHGDSPPRGALWNHDYTRILTWQQNRTGHIWNAIEPQKLFSFENPPALGGAAWTGSETRIISWTNPITSTQLVRVWDAETGEAIHNFPNQRVTGVEAINSDESRLLTWSDDGLVTIWELNAGAVLFIMNHEGVAGVRWDHDYSRVVSWANDGSVLIWDANPNLATPAD